MNQEATRDLEMFVDNARLEMDKLYERYGSPAFFEKAAKLILDIEATGHRIHVSGIGKMHHIACYFASLLSSIGYPAYLLDGTEATHGSAGQVAPGDLVICLSYYGSVEELNRAIVTLRRNGAKILGVTGFPESWIAQNADVHLNVFIEKEGDYIGKPPRMSALSVMFCLQCLSICLQRLRSLSMDDYIAWHPSGKIGEK